MSAVRAAFTVALPMVVYLVVVDRLHAYMNASSALRWSGPAVTSVLVLLCAASVVFLPLPMAVGAMGLCVAASIVSSAISVRHRTCPASTLEHSAQDSRVPQ